MAALKISQNPKGNNREGVLFNEVTSLQPTTTLETMPLPKAFSEEF